MRPIQKITTCLTLTGALIFLSCTKEYSCEGDCIDPPNNSVGPPGDNKCNISNRPIINAQLVPLGTLTQARKMISIGAAGNKLLFAGGVNEHAETSGVDIYDIVSHDWSTAELSRPRVNMAVITLGNKVFFAGGENMGGDLPDYRVPNDFAPNVDIYDGSTNTWTVEYLSNARTRIAAAAVGNKVLFAGGTNEEGWEVLNTVDIYDNSSGKWSVAALSEARESICAVTVGSKVYFAGGNYEFPTSIPSGRIDIYDDATGLWSTSALSDAKDAIASIAVGSRIYWAGGELSSGEITNAVEILDANTGNTSFDCLVGPNAFEYGYSGALATDKRIVFISAFGYPKFDIYDTTIDTWSIGSLNQSILGASFISVNNSIYVAGGTFLSGSNWRYIDRVWKLEF